MIAPLRKISGRCNIQLLQNQLPTFQGDQVRRSLISPRLLLLSYQTRPIAVHILPPRTCSCQIYLPYKSFSTGARDDIRQKQPRSRFPPVSARSKARSTDYTGSGSHCQYLKVISPKKHYPCDAVPLGVYGHFPAISHATATTPLTLIAASCRS